MLQTNNDYGIRYRKLEQPENATLRERFYDIHVRSGHYYQQIRQIAQKNMVMSKRLKLFSLMITATVATILSAQQEGISHSVVLIWILIILGWLAAFMGVLQVISFDDGITEKLFRISMEFRDIKERAKRLELHIEKSDEARGEEEYEELHRDYQKILLHYVDHLPFTFRYYYGNYRGPGRLRVEKTILEKLREWLRS